MRNGVGGLRKPPFGGPERVLDYLGRYTHRVAISNQRLIELKDNVEICNLRRR
jgi:Putative transposase